MMSRSRPRSAIVAAALLLALPALGATLAAPGAVPPARAAGELSPPRTALFTLATLDGRRVTEESYRGKWLLIYFGYTSCPDACPTTLTSIGAALDALGPLAEKVQPLFITIDPMRDKPRVMTAYLKAFDPRIIGLRGTSQQIAEAAKQFQVYYRLQRLADGGYGIDHSGFVYVVNPQGVLAEKLLVGEQLAGPQMAEELSKLVK
ncbi:MAG TPA: SCO family protein [Stellaceae bacterium]|nr:SCO family protein [Stellaceae bacterium]